MFGLFKSSRRVKLRDQPFPPAWEAILARRLAHWRCLSESDKAELRGHIQVFLGEKTFEGCAGLVVTDEMRVLIAAQACMLLLHRETDYYPGLRTILIYPAAYFAQSRTLGPAGIVTEGVTPRSGESWAFGAGAGPVVLSWADVETGAANPCDGFNVVFHEFAHQLDAEDGSVNGAPLLASRSGYAAWARVLGDEYKQLLAQLPVVGGGMIGSYAATSPAEFFAVCTERFFERPEDLRLERPALYDQLRSFYKQDPAADRDRYACQG